MSKILNSILGTFDKVKWDGSAELANKIFGERYGVDWEYISKESTDIVVNGKIIKVGDNL